MRVDTDDFARPCRCGKTHQTDVKEIFIEEGAVEKLEEAMSEGFLKQYISPLLICDTNTCQVTEEKMEDIYDRCQVLVLDADDLQADQHAVEIVENYMDEDIDLILAVGAGTIHDISRYIAFQYKIPFISVPTAASVDGFVSTIAAMNWNGMKTAVQAQPPIAVFADTGIFAHAPERLTASGVSDLLGKYICLADWKIEHIITGEYICEEIIELEEKILKTVRSCLRDIAEGDEPACEKLMYGLIFSGLAAQMAGNSGPSFSAEHHLLQLWEMEVINGRQEALYGEKISVATMLVIQEYKRIAAAIREGRCRVRSYPEDVSILIKKTFGNKDIFEKINKENQPDPLEGINPARLEECLTEIADVIDELPQEEELLQAMKKAGCKYSVYDIGLTDEIISLSLKLAPCVSRRLSLLRISKMLEIEGESL